MTGTHEVVKAWPSLIIVIRPRLMWSFSAIFGCFLEGPQGTKSLALRLAASAFILRTLIAAWLGAFLAFNTRLDFGGHFECGDGHVVGQCL